MTPSDTNYSFVEQHGKNYRAGNIKTQLWTKIVKVKAWQSKISAYLDIVVGNFKDEYKLGIRVLPEQYKIRAAHRSLMSGFVEVLASITRLSFFIGGHEVYKTRKSSAVAKLVIYVIDKYFPLRLLAIKPIIKSLVESHIRGKLREMEIAYTQSILSLSPTDMDYEKNIVWFKQACVECQDLANTLNQRNVVFEGLRFLGQFALGILISIWGARSFSEITSQFLLNSQIGKPLEANYQAVMATVYLLIFLVILLLYGSLFISSIFETKRDIFLGAKVDGLDIYSLENELFHLLNREKSPEWPIDLLFSSVLFEIILLIIFIFNQESGMVLSLVHSGNTFTVIAAPQLLFMAGLFLIFFCRNFITYRKRLNLK